MEKSGLCKDKKVIYISLRIKVMVSRERRKIVYTEIIATPLCASVEGTLKLRMVCKLKLPKKQEWHWRISLQ